MALKKIIYFLYTPLVVILLFSAASVFVFTNSYASIKAHTQALLYNVSFGALTTKYPIENLSMSDIKQACAMNATTGQYAFLGSVCEGVKSGNYITVEEVVNASVSSALDQTLNPFEEELAHINGLLPFFVGFVFILYLFYVALVFMARKESMLYYFSIAVLFALILYFLLSSTVNFLTNTLAEKAAAYIPKEYLASAFTIILDFKQHVFPKIIGDAFNITALLLVLPSTLLGLWHVFEGLLPKKAKH